MLKSYKCMVGRMVGWKSLTAPILRAPAILIKFLLRKHGPDFTSAADVFASESKQFRGCAKTLGRYLQISQGNNTQVRHTFKQSTIDFSFGRILKERKISIIQ